MDKKQPKIQQIVLNDAQKRATKHRAKVLAITLCLFVLLIYVATMAHVNMVN